MITQDTYWTAITAHDAAADGQFVYAVRTTGVYCRPSCKGRLPLRKNVEFYPLPAAAEAAGYRPCKRCRPRGVSIVDERLSLVQQVCDLISTHLDEPELITLDALGAVFHLDPSHLQKTFKSVLDVSPREYAEARRMQKLRDTLRTSSNVTDAIYDAGFRSTSRVYERTDEQLGMTPMQYRARGAGVAIRYTLAVCDLGVLLVATTERGLCAVSLHDDAQAGEAALLAEFPNAALAKDEGLIPFVADILAHIDQGKRLPDVRFDIQATAFQWRVWDALRQIPRGETRTYAQIAHAIGQPAAVRAVASACANNHAALVIPCHRVIGSDGQLRGYRWGVERKAQLLARERAEN
ncbi:MAG: bifunctional DNA-binding transcriptional regulator/O6-methylguanine-DNA methyltransferase Ada [Chloroflexota bacterium]|nr:bifunctional DNA-binding transcriptional regulator/O6-methylguanine-DNA methyltransferase Ada [Chloroflexota bacterium]